MENESTPTESTNAPSQSSTDLPRLTLGQVEQRVLQLVDQGTAANYEIGRLYNYVVATNLATQEGYEDARDFFTQRLKVVSQAALTMYGTIAGKFTEAVAVRYGMAKLYTLLTYAKRINKPVSDGDPAPYLIAVPQKDGTVKDVPFKECSVDALREALKSQRAPDASLTEEDLALIKSYQDGLDGHLPAKHGIRVEAQKKDGALRVTVRNVPAAQAARVIAALVGTQEPQQAPSSSAPRSGETTAQQAQATEPTPSTPPAPQQPDARHPPQQPARPPEMGVQAGMAFNNLRTAVRNAFTRSKPA